MPCHPSQPWPRTNTHSCWAAGEIASRILADAVTLERMQSAETPSARVASSAAVTLTEGEDASDAAYLREMPVPLQLLPPDLSALLPAKRPWMEQGPGAMAVALGEEEKRVVNSVNALLDQMEEQRRHMALRLKESRVGCPHSLRLLRGFGIPRRVSPPGVACCCWEVSPW